MQSISAFPDISKVTGEKTDVSLTFGVCHVIYAFLDLL